MVAIRSTRSRLTLIACAALTAGAAVPASALAERDQSTTLISAAAGGGIPDGPSTHAVISGDQRHARAVAYESDATNIVAGDTNGHRDVFVALRGGTIDNTGGEWKRGRTRLISHGAGGAPANGDSFAAAIDGGFHHDPSCVAFLSNASNLVGGDTNGKTDAFVARIGGGAVRRVSLPRGKQSRGATTAVAVSGNCKLIAFVTRGRLYVSVDGKRPKRLAGKHAADPSFSTGLRTDLVFGAAEGVYLSAHGTGKPRLVAPGGRNPAYNDIKRQVVTYERTIAGHTQIAYRDLGRPEQIISSHAGNDGNADSINPVIGNAGYYVTFESLASNLGMNALGRTGDRNGQPDTYLYTNVRDITLVQSVEHKAQPLPGGGQNPSMSFYANYIVFDSPGPLGAFSGPHQVYMRWLGGL